MFFRRASAATSAHSLTVSLRRLGERADTVAKLQEGARALEERDFSKAVRLFEDHDGNLDARQGAAAARFGEISERGQQALARSPAGFSPTGAP